MNTVSVWTPVKIEDIRIGDRIRAKSRLYDSVHEFTVREVSQDYYNWVADGVFTYGTFPTAVEVNERFDFERESMVPTTPGLYRFKNREHVKNGLVLDASGNWWWYDLSISARLDSAADLEKVYQLVPDMVLVDAWDNGTDQGWLI